MVSENASDGTFRPALSTQEAVARMFALTGVSASGRGEKRALVALRDALGVNVDVVATGAVLGAHLADALGQEWLPARDTVRNKLSLAGHNRLLAAAAEARRAGSLRRVRERSTVLEGPEWEAFNPAVSKIEAVTRIAALTGSPREWLGPGGKEHKSVLINLADRLLPDADLDRSSKTRLAASIAAELGVPWTDACYSTGETIQLVGLNQVLAGAERRLGMLGTSLTESLGSPRAEGEALTAALFEGWDGAAWEARSCIEWLQRRRLRGYNDTEWQGWYFEARAREILSAAFPPPATPVQVTYANTTFDFALNYVWDLKAHTDEKVFPSDGRREAERGAVILNDERAVRRCVDDGGLGFLMLSGGAVMDEDGSFLAWHRQFKAEQGVLQALSNSGRSRMRKVAFTPYRVEAFWVQNRLALDAAVLEGALGVQTIGRQPPRIAGQPGAIRPGKFVLRPRQASSALLVAGMSWR